MKCSLHSQNIGKNCEPVIGYFTMFDGVKIHSCPAGYESYKNDFETWTFIREYNTPKLSKILDNQILKVCSEIKCKNISIKFTTINIDGIIIFVPLCEKHSLEIINGKIKLRWGAIYEKIW